MLKIDNKIILYLILSIVLSHIYASKKEFVFLIVIFFVSSLIFIDYKYVLVGFFIFIFVFTKSTNQFNAINKIYYEKNKYYNFELLRITSTSQWNSNILVKELSSNKNFILNVSDKNLDYIKSLRIFDVIKAKIFFQKLSNTDRWMLSRHVVGKGKIIDIKNVEYKFSILRLFPRFFDSACSRHKEVGSILCNMIYLSDQQISKDDRELFNTAGLQHIVVVSGSNLALFVLVIWSCLNRFLLTNKTKNFISIFLCIFFALINGLDPSIVRACFMLGFLCLLNILHIKSSHIIASILAISLLTVFDPLIVYSKGFWLSVVCSIALIFYNNNSNESGNALESRIGWNASIICFIATTPILIASNGINYRTLLINLIFVPIFSVLSTLSYILIPIESILHILFFPLTNIFSFVIELLKRLT